MSHRIVMTAAILLMASSGAYAADEISLVGTWIGHRERAAKVEGWRDGTATLVVTEQRGLTFTGSLKRANADGDVEEKLWGAFTPAGRLMMGADKEGTYAFELVDANTLDYCYTEAGARASRRLRQAVPSALTFAAAVGAADRSLSKWSAGPVRRGDGSPTYRKSGPGVIACRF
jgi:hypothetical protein